MTETDDTDEFADGLADLILEHFGEGADVEGTTVVTYDRESLPTWAVKISRAEDGQTSKSGSSSGASYSDSQSM